MFRHNIFGFKAFIDKYYPELRADLSRNKIEIYKKYITQKDWFSVKQCNDNPDNLYVFGDNTLRIGKGGQAQIRDCENSFGICTKRTPSTDDDAYFRDTLSDWEFIVEDLKKLKEVEKKYKSIIFPADGLGTGLSEMPNRCPKLYTQFSKHLEDNYGFLNP